MQKDIYSERALLNCLESLYEQLNGMVQVTAPEKATKSLIVETISKSLDKENEQLTIIDRSVVLQTIVDEIFGFGPISSLLRDSSIDEIRVFKFNKIAFFKVHSGEQQSSHLKFRNEVHLRLVLERLLHPQKLSELGMFAEITLVEGTKLILNQNPKKNAPMVVLRKHGANGNTGPDTDSSPVPIGPFEPKRFIEIVLRLPDVTDQEDDSELSVRVERR